jgi:hypothetical protein
VRHFLPTEAQRRDAAARAALAGADGTHRKTRASSAGKGSDSSGGELAFAAELAAARRLVRRREERALRQRHGRVNRLALPRWQEPGPSRSKSLPSRRLRAMLAEARCLADVSTARAGARRAQASWFPPGSVTLGMCRTA